jgi:glucose/arabinose dehydrogenase
LVEKWADVPKARSMAVSPDGNYVFVGTQNDQVYRVKVKSDSQKVRQVEVFAKGLECPNGVTFSKNRLLVAERQRVVAYKNWSQTVDESEPQDPEIIIEQLPSERAHGWRYMKAGPNDEVRIAIGAPWKRLSAAR